MQLIAPDLLVDLRELPLAATAAIAVIGAAMWSTGWWTHRFWVGLSTSFVAGLIGLKLGPEAGVPPIVTGLLAAIGAGCVALAVGRVVLFLWYGLVCWYLVHLYAPQFEVPIACILTGGLISVLCYRFCVMLLTSTVGLFGLIYGGLILAERIVRFDAVRWSTGTRENTINLIFLGLMLAGVFVQVIVGKAKDHYGKRFKDWQDFMKKQQQARASAPRPVGIKGLLARFRKAA